MYDVWMTLSYYGVSNMMTAHFINEVPFRRKDLCADNIILVDKKMSKSKRLDHDGIDKVL